MSDRHWMEKWKWRHEPEPARLVRKADGKEAESWQHAAEIEGAERGVDSTTMLTDQRYAMVPLKELYPSDERVDEPIRLGERREQKEQREYAARMAAEVEAAEDEIPWAVKPEGQQGSKSMLFLGWIMTVIAAMLFLIAGSLTMGLVLVLAFFGGAAVATHISKG
jgi:hypothetical protein